MKALFIAAKKRASKLKCHYVTNSHPFLLIGPVKQEEIFDRPAIWIYYDVVSESQIQLMKTLALPKVDTNYKLYTSRAVRPFFRQKPAYLNLKKKYLLFFHAICISL